MSQELERGTNLMWIQEAGGWSSAKMLLDVYGHFMPTENAGFADAITTADGTPAAPIRIRALRAARRSRLTPRAAKRKMEPTIRVERTTCSLRDGSEGEENQ